MNVRQLEWEQYKGTAIPGEKMIGRELPDLLQTTLAYENINKFIHCVPFFHGADPSFVSTLCKYALIYHYAEGEVVLYEVYIAVFYYIIFIVSTNSCKIRLFREEIVCEHAHSDC